MTRPSRVLAAVLPPALALAAILAAAEGEEVKPEALFDSARKAYDAKQYGRALTEVNLLAGALARLRVAQIQAVLPAAPAGWTAEDPTGEAIPAAILGGGVTVKRVYRKGGDEGASVDLEVLSDAAAVGMIAPVLANPALFLGQENVSVITVKGRRAVLEHDKAARSGKLQILLNSNTTLLSLSGSAVERADLVETLAGALDLAALEKILAD